MFWIIRIKKIINHKLIKNITIKVTRNRKDHHKMKNREDRRLKNLCEKLFVD